MEYTVWFLASTLTILHSDLSNRPVIVTDS
jgi:hypothetical protein